MKRLLSMLSFCWLTHLSYAQTHECSVEITGLKSNSGKCLVYLFKDKNGFPTDVKYAIAITSATISNGKCAALFKAVSDGEYAIAVIHDENNNGKLDTNFLGIPKEGIGTSNNAKSTLGPPSFTDSKFQSKDKSNSMTITIKYL